ncbi:MAG: exonuclease domain-containing protein [Rhodospirillales bacterium]|nr:exonuclease domain-containing protein [Rhodospirillales bacterium]
MKISRLSTRRLAGLWTAVLGVILAAAASAVAWLVLGAGQGPGQAVGQALHLVVWIFAVTAVICFCAWIWLNRELHRRELDAAALPERPEFYDYSLLDLPRHMQELDGRTLRSLDFTVFDTETTGLRPSQGDELISIGAVGVHGGEVAESRSFDEFINPGMDIPKASIRIHGITDDMVADKPGADAVVPRFRAFVGDTVLVAHNAAFDLTFLKLKEAETGARFDHVVLDTLLISVFLDRDTDDHSLETIAKRHGVTIENRHSAVGDAVATAQIFAAMLERLEARGVSTLDQLIRACDEMVAVRKLQARM